MDEATLAQTPEIAAQPDALHPLRLIGVLRSAGSALIVQAALHVQLARVEWAEEKNRLLQMQLTMLLGFVLVNCLLLLLGALVLALSWDTAYRTVTAAALAGVYALGAALAARRLHTLAERGDASFAATREELAADLALLRSKL